MNIPQKRWYPRNLRMSESEGKGIMEVSIARNREDWIVQDASEKRKSEEVRGKPIKCKVKCKVKIS